MVELNNEIHNPMADNYPISTLWLWDLQKNPTRKYFVHVRQQLEKEPADIWSWNGNTFL